jgi:PKHD-type hydroxylase
MENVQLFEFDAKEVNENIQASENTDDYEYSNLNDYGQDRVLGDHVLAYPSCYIVGSIPPDLVDLMVKEVENIPEIEFSGAQVGREESNARLNSIRNSKVSWWYEHHWVSSIFSHYINLANRTVWEYDLTYLSGIQVSTYEVDGHYKWHSDYGVSYDQRHTRKLSASLLVSDPSEYEGGVLEILDYHNNVIPSPAEKGSLIIFDSRIPHRVTPVTKGKRISLVTWMLGPKLR